MPKNCVVFGCANHNWKQRKQRLYFVLPKRAKSPQRRDKWLAALHRENEDGSHWSPPKSRVVCSDHFVSGRPVKNPMHPDYAPSILPHLPQSGKKASHRMDSYERHQLTTSKRELAAENSKNDLSKVCHSCGMEESDNPQWICCEICDRWFHHECVLRPDVNGDYLCPACS
nr:lysine-specific demethylase 5B-B-like [Nerophis lumbriciformis]